MTPAFAGRFQTGPLLVSVDGAEPDLAPAKARGLRYVHLPITYGGQMCPTSSFLRTLNSGDDTPGSTAWTTIYSTNDEVVPNSASRVIWSICSRIQSLLGARPALKGNFFTLDLRQGRAAFQRVPWVQRAVVRRVWPRAAR